MRRRLPLAIAAAVAALLAGTLPAGAAPEPAPPATPSAAIPTAQLPPGLLAPKADIVVDAETGRVLIGDHIHEPLRPASTAKIMTGLVAVERLAADAPVAVDGPAAAVESNKIGMTLGTRWPLDKMLAALMMVSANDAAYAIAHTVGGNLDGFAADLNETAKRLGLRDSILGDPAGLDTPASYKGGPYMSAYDLAIATRNALSVPALASWAAKSVYDFTDPAGAPHHLTNHNRFLPGASYGYLGATGFKTGWTTRAQHSLVATATRNGRTLIAVVIGAVNLGYLEAGALLDAGFAMTPDASTTGETLPPNRVSLYAERAADRSAFAGLGAAATGAGATQAEVVTPVANVPSTFELSQSPRAAPATTVVAADNGGSGLLSWRNVAIVLILVVGVTFFLRRRAVRRRRAARIARRRQRMAAMRSGGLPVVDGKYRPGTRLGPPLESHVRVRRVDDELDALDA